MRIWLRRSGELTKDALMLAYYFNSKSFAYQLHKVYDLAFSENILRQSHIHESQIFVYAGCRTNRMA